MVPGEDTDTRPSETDCTCPVCGGWLARFQDVVVGDYAVKYHCCLACGLIHSLDRPFFEEVLYPRDYFEDVDTGWQQRAQEVCRLLISCFGRSKREDVKVLDVGAGNNYVVSLLVQAGFDAWGLDYHSTCLFRPDRFVQADDQLPHRVFDVVTAVEVIEHFTRPVHEFENLLSFLKPGGALFFSTEVQSVKAETGHVPYMNPSAGHCTLWSRKALETLFLRYGFKSARIKAGGNRHVWFRQKRWFGSFGLQARAARLRHLAWQCLHWKRRRSERSLCSHRVTGNTIE